ncbi:FAD dependent oxidoreductase [Macrophomina phaseolina]|uniref:FAD dependent oxidoreductase n=1 Tax=Macrophomina phaseolina TaxID=35725 RepID=A0ABQ8GBB6_9PEZI|nr:FAD dependent oxidoreductase [Macrophomina phaseolina]
MPPTKQSRIAIIGAGAFGLSTALELSHRGYRNITVFDRYPPPAPDGSSVDISRIIRNDYADPVYARMATEAMSLWETQYAEHYSRSGFVLMSSRGGGDDDYVAKSRATLRNLSHPYEDFEGTAALKHLFPGFQGDVPTSAGYMNRQGGWANAAGAIATLAQECAAAGVSFITGAKGTVASLQTVSSSSSSSSSADRQIQNIVTEDGSVLPVDAVIVAAGAWTNQLLDMRHAFLATAQPVGFVQLSEAEARELRGAPVMIDFDTGCFTFPPTQDTHVLKIARHGWGYERPVEVSFRGGRRREGGKEGDGNDKVVVVSSPMRERRGLAVSYLPGDAEEGLRRGLEKLWPGLAGRPWKQTRLCWYCDTAGGDFIFDEHPDYQGVFVASGGSGHGFKFLPVLGRYIVDCFEGIASAELRAKWAFRSGSSADFLGDGSRGGPKRRKLSDVELSRLINESCAGCRDSRL